MRETPARPDTSRVAGPLTDASLTEIAPALYDELRRAAARLMAAERPGHTMPPTALVHEAWLRLEGAHLPTRDRSHLVGLVARTMRQVLVDHARRRLTLKRGAGVAPASLDEAVVADHRPADELLALDEALERLACLHPRWHQVVEWRFFAGLTEAEVAGLLGVTERTVQREWARARAWLYREMDR